MVQYYFNLLRKRKRYYLAFYDKMLFSDGNYRWRHRLVVKTVYDNFKLKGALGIPQDFTSETKDCLNDYLYNFMEEVFEVYGQYSRYKLTKMTQSEKPWLITKRK